jgi:Ig-like domain CHU_C associated
MGNGNKHSTTPAQLDFRILYAMLLKVSLGLASVFHANDTAAQTITSVKDGNWSAPETWENGIVPQTNNSSLVNVNHQVDVTSGVSVSIDNVVINGSLSIEAGAEVNIADGDSIDLMILAPGRLEVRGTLICRDGATLGGTNISNTSFFDGAVYRLWSTNEGSIPLAQWDANSTIEIRGIEGNTTMRSANWGQTFGNLLYDCPDQGAFVEFKGLLRHLGGDLVIANTNRAVLRLAQSQDLNLQVDGNIEVTGPSEVWFGMSGNANVVVGGDFMFNSSSTASSYFTTTGYSTITVNGNLTMNGVHRLKLASSTSSGHTDVIVKGDFNVLHGKMDALGSGTGTFIFDGTQRQHVVTLDDDNTGFEGNLSYLIRPSADVDLGQSLLSNTTGGDFIVQGILRMGSLNPTGVLQAGQGGNVDIKGAVTFNPGSQVIFSGTGEQFLDFDDVGEGQTIIDNPSGLTLLSDIQVGDLLIRRGILIAGTKGLWLRGDLTIEDAGSISTIGTLWMNGTGVQSLNVRGQSLHNLSVQSGDGSDVRLLTPLPLSGILTIYSAGSNVISNGNLILQSTSEAAGSTASIGPLPAGSAVIGEVTVQRFIHGAEDKYRYISSPVNSSPVAALMDDIPVTGLFEDPSVGPGLPQHAPSLFYYDEGSGDWKAFPTSGSAATNYLEPGTGYSVFNWNGIADTNWDVTGEINQGEFSFNLSYTPRENDSLDGWNLIGNPYPSAISWSDGLGWIRNEMVSPGIAVRDNLSGKFRYWDGEMGSLSNGLIASGQSFWVRAVGPSPQLKVMEAAKTSAGAEYYRKNIMSYLELEASFGQLADRAYFRLRDGATEPFDPYDIPKLSNDSLSVSFLTPDSVDVAIEAVERLPCYFQIPIKVAFEGEVSRGLTLKIRSFGLFQTSRLSLLDTRSGLRFFFDKTGTVTLGHPDTDYKNLCLVVASDIPQATPISAAEMVCDGDTLVVNINKQQGINYFLEYAGRYVTPIPDHSTMSVSFPSDSLGPDLTLYQLIAQSACGEAIVLDTLRVSRVVVKPPKATEGFHCGPGRVLMQAAPAREEILWYDEFAGVMPLDTGPAFLSPVLTKSKKYYVSARDEHGCESNRYPVSANINTVDQIAIRYTGNKLSVEPEPGILYQWYLNDSTLIDQFDSFVVPEDEGTYRVVASRDGCSSYAEFPYYVGGVDSLLDLDRLIVFPNPCSEVLFVHFPEKMASGTIDIFSLSGTWRKSSVLESDEAECEIDCRELPQGQYVARISGIERTWYVRFVKID